MDSLVRLLLTDSYALVTHTLAFALQNPESGSHGFSLMAALREMSWTGMAVIVVLLLMSIYSIAIMLERYLTFSAAARQSRAFVPRAAEMLRAAHLDDAIKLSQNYRRSHLAVVINSGLQEIAAQQGDNAERKLRKAKRALKRATAVKTTDLQRGLSGLATIGSTAPFVGLFGTVVGIINTFEIMNDQQTAGFSAVAGGISEALVATAFGLVVAIPAVWMYNYFTNRVHVFAVEMNNSADELMDYFLQRQETA